MELNTYIPIILFQEQMAPILNTPIVLSFDKEKKIITTEIALAALSLQMQTLPIPYSWNLSIAGSGPRILYANSYHPSEPICNDLDIKITIKGHNLNMATTKKITQMMKNFVFTTFSRFAPECSDAKLSIRSFKPVEIPYSRTFLGYKLQTQEGHLPVELSIVILNNLEEPEYVLNIDSLYIPIITKDASGQVRVNPPHTYYLYSHANHTECVIADITNRIFKANLSNNIGKYGWTRALLATVDGMTTPDIEGPQFLYEQEITKIEPSKLVDDICLYVQNKRPPIAYHQPQYLLFILCNAFFSPFTSNNFQQAFINQAIYFISQEQSTIWMQFLQSLPFAKMDPKTAILTFKLTLPLLSQNIFIKNHLGKPHLLCEFPQENFPNRPLHILVPFLDENDEKAIYQLIDLLCDKEDVVPLEFFPNPVYIESSTISSLQNFSILKTLCQSSSYLSQDIALSWILKFSFPCEDLIEQIALQAISNKKFPTLNQQICLRKLGVNQENIHSLKLVKNQLVEDALSSPNPSLKILSAVLQEFDSSFLRQELYSQLFALLSEKFPPDFSLQILALCCEEKKESLTLAFLKSQLALNPNTFLDEKIATILPNTTSTPLEWEQFLQSLFSYFPSQNTPTLPSLLIKKLLDLTKPFSFKEENLLLHLQVFHSFAITDPEKALVQMEHLLNHDLNKLQKVLDSTHQDFPSEWIWKSYNHLYKNDKIASYLEGKLSPCPAQGNSHEALISRISHHIQKKNLKQAKTLCLHLNTSSKTIKKENIRNLLESHIDYTNITHAQIIASLLDQCDEDSINALKNIISKQDTLLRKKDLSKITSLLSFILTPNLSQILLQDPCLYRLFLQLSTASLPKQQTPLCKKILQLIQDPELSPASLYQERLTLAISYITYLLLKENLTDIDFTWTINQISDQISTKQGQTLALQIAPIYPKASLIFIQKISQQIQTSESFQTNSWKTLQELLSYIPASFSEQFDLNSIFRPLVGYICTLPSTTHYSDHQIDLIRKCSQKIITLTNTTPQSLSLANDLIEHFHIPALKRLSDSNSDDFSIYCQHLTTMITSHQTLPTSIMIPATQLAAITKINSQNANIVCTMIASIYKIEHITSSSLFLTVLFFDILKTNPKLIDKKFKNPNFVSNLFLLNLNRIESSSEFSILLRFYINLLTDHSSLLNQDYTGLLLDKGRQFIKQEAPFLERDLPIIIADQFLLIFLNNTRKPDLKKDIFYTNFLIFILDLDAFTVTDIWQDSIPSDLDPPKSLSEICIRMIAQGLLHGACDSESLFQKLSYTMAVCQEKNLMQVTKELFTQIMPRRPTWNFLNKLASCIESNMRLINPLHDLTRQQLISFAQIFTTLIEEKMQRFPPVATDSSLTPIFDLYLRLLQHCEEVPCAHNLIMQLILSPINSRDQEEYRKISIDKIKSCKDKIRKINPKHSITKIFPWLKELAESQQVLLQKDHT